LAKIPARSSVGKEYLGRGLEGVEDGVEGIRVAIGESIGWRKGDAGFWLKGEAGFPGKMHTTKKKGGVQLPAKAIGRGGDPGIKGSGTNQVGFEGDPVDIPDLVMLEAMGSIIHIGKAHLADKNRCGALGNPEDPIETNHPIALDPTEITDPESPYLLKRKGRKPGEKGKNLLPSGTGIEPEKGPARTIVAGFRIVSGVYLDPSILEIHLDGVLSGCNHIKAPIPEKKEMVPSRPPRGLYPESTGILLLVQGVVVFYKSESPRNPSPKDPSPFSHPLRKKLELIFLFPGVSAEIAVGEIRFGGGGPAGGKKEGKEKESAHSITFPAS
jgi:hypothetical protein